MDVSDKENGSKNRERVKKTARGERTQGVANNKSPPLAITVTEADDNDDQGRSMDTGEERVLLSPANMQIVVSPVGGSLANGKARNGSAVVANNNYNSHLSKRAQNGTIPKFVVDSPNDVDEEQQQVDNTSIPVSSSLSSENTQPQNNIHITTQAPTPGTTNYFMFPNEAFTHSGLFTHPANQLTVTSLRSLRSANSYMGTDDGQGVGDPLLSPTWNAFAFSDPSAQLTVQSIASIGMGSTDGRKLYLRRVPTTASELMNFVNPNV